MEPIPLHTLAFLAKAAHLAAEESIRIQQERIKHEKIADARAYLMDRLHAIGIPCEPEQLTLYTWPSGSHSVLLRVENGHTPFALARNVDGYDKGTVSLLLLCSHCDGWACVCSTVVDCRCPGEQGQKIALETLGRHLSRDFQKEPVVCCGCDPES